MFCESVISCNFGSKSAGLANFPVDLITTAGPRKCSNRTQLNLSHCYWLSKCKKWDTHVLDCFLGPISFVLSTDSVLWYEIHFWWFYSYFLFCQWWKDCMWPFIYVQCALFSYGGVLENFSEPFMHLCLPHPSSHDLNMEKVKTNHTFHQSMKK